jgi:hypothetical protein
MKTGMKNKSSGPAKYWVERGLDGLVERAVNGANTIQDISEYLSQDPHPGYRLVSCQWVEGNYTLVWELKEPPVIITSGGCGHDNR